MKGKIGSWNIDGTANQQKLWSAKVWSTGNVKPETYVALSSYDGCEYAIWCGSDDMTKAPFRVKRDGTVYLMKVVDLDETGKERTIDLGSAGLWKIGSNYMTIKSVSSSGLVTLSDGSSFNSAASVKIQTGSWSGDDYKIKLTNNAEYTVISNASVEHYLDDSATPYSFTLNSGSNYVGYSTIRFGAVNDYGSGEYETIASGAVYVNAKPAYDKGRTSGWEESWDLVKLNYTSDQTISPGGSKTIYPYGKPTPTASYQNKTTVGVKITASLATVDSVEAPGGSNTQFTVKSTGTQIESKSRTYYLTKNGDYIEVHQGSQTGTVVAKRSYV